MSADTFREINGRPILWQSVDGHVHVCEGADVHRGVRLIWTLCQRDVPANAAFHPATDDRATCQTCLAAAERNPQ